MSVFTPKYILLEKNVYTVVVTVIISAVLDSTSEFLTFVIYIFSVFKFLFGTFHRLPLSGEILLLICFILTINQSNFNAQVL